MPSTAARDVIERKGCSRSWLYKNRPPALRRQVREPLALLQACARPVHEREGGCGL